MVEPSQEWVDDCMHWWGKVLTGKYAHWCGDWDDLPINEWCEEFSACTCYPERYADSASEGTCAHPVGNYTCPTCGIEVRTAVSEDAGRG
jgi:hypothetical protein